jgi:hypothetical protein
MSFPSETPTRGLAAAVDIDRRTGLLVTAATKNIYTPQTYSDDELIQAMKTLISSNKPPPDSVIRPLTKYVHSELPAAVAAGRYRDAEDLERASQLLYQFTHATSEFTRRKAARDKQLHKLESSRNALQETAAVWDRKIREAETAAARHLEDVRAAHFRESEAFEADWSDPDFLLAFRKPSHVLLQLREIERVQGLTKAFADAENTRKRAGWQERE